ncbi:MAG: glycosyltransferase family 4 protein [Bacillota bacterium]
MRLVIATPLYPPEPGGPSTYAKVLEEGLPSRDIEVAVIKFSDVRHKPKFVRHVMYFWRVFQAAKDVDAVLALDPVSVGLPALCAALLRRKKFVVKIVGDYAWEQGRQRFNIWLPLDEFVRTPDVPLPVLGLRLVQKFVASRATAIIVPSEYLKRIVARWGIPEDRITVIVNAKPVDVPGTPPEALAAIPHPRIVSSGRLVPWKGMHGLIAAMIHIRAKVPGAQLVIIGDGPDREALERYATLRLKEGFTFLGALPHAEALAVMKEADVFVLNSSYEGLSHILLEALELGKAIVTTKAGGNPEVIENGKNGLVISVGDPEALADACISILSDPNGKAQLEAHARESAHRYEPALMLDRTAEFLSSVV